jgi:hypothetical protein
MGNGFIRIILSGLLLMGGARLSAQVVTATLYGTVADPSELPYLERWSP